MTRILFSTLLAAAMAGEVVGKSAAATLPTAKPEEVGLSSERLQRIYEMMMRRVEANEISGAVTLVARRGRPLMSC